VSAVRKLAKNISKLRPGIVAISKKDLGAGIEKEFSRRSRKNRNGSHLRALPFTADRSNPAQRPSSDQDFSRFRSLET